MLKVVREILPPEAKCVFIRQSEALGLGHAVLCAKPVVGDEPFAVLLADDLLTSDNKPVLSQMADVYNFHKCPVLGVQEVPMEEVHQYGVVDAKVSGDRTYEVSGMVEKPPQAEAPSNLAVVGRYILPGEIFALLETQERGAGNEIQLTDAIARLLSSQRLLAYTFEGKRFDCGSKLGYLQAQVELALAHEEVSDEFREYLLSLDLGGMPQRKVAAG